MALLFPVLNLKGRSIKRFIFLLKTKLSRVVFPSAALPCVFLSRWEEEIPHLHSCKSTRTFNSLASLIPLIIQQIVIVCQALCKTLGILGTPEIIQNNVSALQRLLSSRDT